MITPTMITCSFWPNTAWRCRLVVRGINHNILHFDTFIHETPGHVRSGALFASLTGMLAMLIHSLVEFNFQIPANALYFWVLAGTGLAATRLGHAENDGYGYRHGYKRRSLPRIESV
jgi:hypothetical protein